jgi:hypothetical protein
VIAALKIALCAAVKCVVANARSSSAAATADYCALLHSFVSDAQ